MNPVPTYHEVEGDVHVFAEPARVVVLVGSGIAEGLEHGVGLQQLVFDGLHARLVARGRRDELQDLLRGLRLARTGLSCTPRRPTM